jgi:hypothetical protein
MDDLERYGDYNETEDDIPRGKSHVGLILKILVGVVCISVIAVLAFRLVLFNSYPDSMENIYFNDKLTAYYNETNGDIGALTQSLSTPYDDPDEGNLFCDNLIVIPGINQLQISVRYNVSLMESIKEKYGVELDPDGKDLFTFKLSIIPFTEENKPIATGTVSVPFTESKMMYRYIKLVVDDVDFEAGGAEHFWIRLETYINGVEMEKPYENLIYQDDEGSKFSKYGLSSKEKP